MSMENKSLCAAFWQHTNIRPGDRVYPCCRFKSSIKKFDGNLETLLDSKEYTTLRNLSEQGKKIKGCEKCYYEEEIGHKSLRQEFNETYGFEKKLTYLEIGMDNLCNMACDGCNSEFSTQWMSIEKEKYGKPLHGHLTVSDIKFIPPTVEKVLFLGGEPLLTDKHLSLLETHTQPENCHVVYNTNTSIIPNSHCTDVWSNFAKVSFIASVDGYKEANERVRSGSKWDQTVKFLEWTLVNGYDLQVNTVLHKNNLFEVFRLENFIKNFTPNWYINVLTYPTELDIKNASSLELEKFKVELEKSTIPNRDFIKNHLN